MKKSISAMLFHSDISALKHSYSCVPSASDDFVDFVLFE